jgi:periplasmic mercuric ion binding protein
MKSLQLIFIAFFMLIFSAYAQPKAYAKAVIKVPALTCEVCKDKLEQYLFKAYGVTKVKADFKKHTVSVSWVTDRTNIEEIKTHIANNGFDADDVTAEENAAKKLPPCCKRTDGVATNKPTTAIKSKPELVTVVEPAKPDTVKRTAVQKYLEKQKVKK